MRVDSGVDRDDTADVISGDTGDVMCRCPRGDSEAVRDGDAAGLRQRSTDGSRGPGRPAPAAGRRPRRAVGAAGGSRRRPGGRRRGGVPADDAAHAADAADRDARAAGVRVRLADAGADLRRQGGAAAAARSPAGRSPRPARVLTHHATHQGGRAGHDGQRLDGGGGHDSHDDDRAE